MTDSGLPLRIDTKQPENKGEPQARTPSAGNSVSTKSKSRNGYLGLMNDSESIALGMGMVVTPSADNDQSTNRPSSSKAGDFFMGFSSNKKMSFLNVAAAASRNSGFKSSANGSVVTVASQGFVFTADASSSRFGGSQHGFPDATNSIFGFDSYEGSRSNGNSNSGFPMSSADNNNSSNLKRHKTVGGGGNSSHGDSSLSVLKRQLSLSAASSVNGNTDSNNNSSGSNGSGGFVMKSLFHTIGKSGVTRVTMIKINKL